MTLVIIHELGHFTTAKLFNIKTDKIYIYPLGGITKMNMDINTNKLKELIILIMGPLSQQLSYVILLNIFDKDLVRMYHYNILLFNLLPIYPLDGGKILNILLNNLLPFKKTLKVTILLSYLLTIIIYLSNNKLSVNMIITYILLVALIRKEELKIPIYYQKFILERYLNNYKFIKKRKINNINDMYLYRENVIVEGNKEYSEKEYLNKNYYKFNKNC